MARSWFDDPKHDPDIKAPDGFLLGGWRTVRKGGKIRFQHTTWQHPELVSLVGERVFVHVDCCWATTASFTPDPDRIHDSYDRTPLEPLTVCQKCGDENGHRDEAACLECGWLRPWATASEPYEAYS